MIKYGVEPEELSEETLRDENEKKEKETEKKKEGQAHEDTPAPSIFRRKTP